MWTVTYAPSVSQKAAFTWYYAQFSQAILSWLCKEVVLDRIQIQKQVQIIGDANFRKNEIEILIFQNQFTLSRN